MLVTSKLYFDFFCCVVSRQTRCAFASTLTYFIDSSMKSCLYAVCIRAENSFCTLQRVPGSSYVKNVLCCFFKSLTSKGPEMLAWSSFKIDQPLMVYRLHSAISSSPTEAKCTEKSQHLKIKPATRGKYHENSTYVYQWHLSSSLKTRISLIWPDENPTYVCHGSENILWSKGECPWEYTQVQSKIFLPLI